MLKRIATHDVEPVDLDVAPLAPRLNLLAGDNGLGKTFLLDLAWWALSTQWDGHQAIPRRSDKSAPTIRYWVGSSPVEAHFDFQGQWWQKDWPTGRELDLVFGRELALYGRADGGFLVQDSLRHFGPREDRPGIAHWLQLSVDDLWNGRETEEGAVLCNGLIRDWVTWQFQKPTIFELFTRVLAKLSPHPDEILRPGPPRRVSIEDARDIPTIVLPYGEVPITHASAGMRRVLALAYMLVWTWYEHTEAARLTNVAPLDELVLLIDEVDAHLHPTWQRVILPALFEVFPEIERSLRVQVIASTHAPLVPLRLGGDALRRGARRAPPLRPPRRQDRRRADPLGQAGRRGQLARLRRVRPHSGAITRGAAGHRGRRGVHEGRRHAGRSRHPGEDPRGAPAGAGRA